MDSQSSDTADRPLFSEGSEKFQGDFVMENASEEAISVTVSCQERLHQLNNGDSLDFGAWKKLITEIEKIHPDDINIISSAYDSLLSKFPLCHWYWQRYAYHQARLCNANKAVEIFEQAVELTPFSVGLWYEYCHFAITYFDDRDDARRLFQKGITIVGKDYYCHVLWDKYILFEFSQQKWIHLAKVYAQAIRFPTQKLQKYYKIFKDFVTILEEEIQSLNHGNLEVQAELYNDASALSDKEISRVVNDLWDPCDISVRCKALHRYKFIGDQLYQNACQLDEKIKSFESNIRRRYFDTTPLDDDQLNNWHQYLDFIEEQEDFDWALKLYERCLISCANYPEFWMRYVDFMEAQGGRELAMFAIERATKVFLSNIPGVHLFSARFMEQIRDLDGARASFSNYDTGCDIYFIESVVRQANMERRLGNKKAAYEIYEKALRWATLDKEKQHFLPKLYIHYFHLKCMMTRHADASRDVLIKGIKQLPDCRLLYEELIAFAMMHDGAKQLSFIDSVITTAISSSSDGFKGLDIKDREYISTLFLEFVDLCGTVHDVRKAWNLHVKLFPQFIRVNPLFKRPTSKEQRINCSVLHNLQSKNQSSGHLIQQPEQEMLPLTPPVDNKQPISVSAEQISTQNDDDQPSSKVSVDFEDESKTDASKRLELTDDRDQMDWTANTICQSKEDASRPLEPIDDREPPSGPNVPTEPSQVKERSINVLCPKELELEHRIESVSLEEHSSDCQRKVPKDQVLMASDHGNNNEIPATNSSRSAEFHNGGCDRSVAIPDKVLDADFTQSQNVADGNSHTARTASSGGSEFIHNPKLLDQQLHPLQAGSRQEDLTVEIHPLQTENGQDGPVISHMFSSPVSCTQGNTAECTMQTSQQVGPTYYDQASYQMWQYYYQQQYQQFLQMQQSYPHLQLQQQYLQQTYQHQQFQQQMPYLQQMQQYFQQQYQQMGQPMQPHLQVHDQQLQPCNQTPALACQYQMNQQGYQQLLQQYQQHQQRLHTMQQQEQGGYPQGQQHQEQEQLDQGQQITKHGNMPLESQSEQVSPQSKTTDGSGHRASTHGSL